MTKGLTFTAISIAASALIATSLSAGTIYSDINATTAYAGMTKASEITGAMTATNVAAYLGGYVPSTIALTTLSNPTFNYTVANGSLSFGNSAKYYYVLDVNSTNNTYAGTLVAKYTSGSGTSAIAFGATGPQVSNARKYTIVMADNDVAINDGNVSAAVLVNAAAPVINYAQSNASASDTLTIKLGQGDSQTISDTATGALLTSGQQLCASVTTKADAKIDANDGFKSFGLTSGTCATGTSTKTDTVVVGIRATEKTVNAVQAAVDGATIVLRATPALPTGTTAAMVTTTNTASKACTVSTDRTTVTCETLKTLNLTNFVSSIDDENATVTLTIPGTVAMARTTFTADVQFDFNNTLATDYSATNLLLNAADAGVWTYKGTSLTTATINANADTNTMIKLNNDSLLAANVYWTLTDDAGVAVTMFTANSASGVATLGAGKSDTWLASTLQTAARAINPAFGEKFRGSALITSETGVTGTSVMMINGGRDRVYPLN